MPQKSIRQALNEALRQEMRRDPRIIVIGEDVAGGAGSEGQRDAYGGVLGRDQGPLRRVRRGAGHRHADHRVARSWAPPPAPR